MSTGARSDPGLQHQRHQAPPAGGQRRAIAAEHRPRFSARDGTCGPRCASRNCSASICGWRMPMRRAASRRSACMKPIAPNQPVSSARRHRRRPLGEHRHTNRDQVDDPPGMLVLSNSVAPAGAHQLRAVGVEGHATRRSGPSGRGGGLLVSIRGAPLHVARLHARQRQRAAEHNAPRRRPRRPPSGRRGRASSATRRSRPPRRRRANVDHQHGAGSKPSAAGPNSSSRLTTMPSIAWLR